MVMTSGRLAVGSAGGMGARERAETGVGGKKRAGGEGNHKRPGARVSEGLADEFLGFVRHLGHVLSVGEGH